MPAPEFERNFPEKYGLSPQRVALTSFKRPTQMQLNKLKELVKAEQGVDPEKNFARFMDKAGMAVGDCCQAAINQRLQAQYEKDFEMLAVKNKRFMPGMARPVAGAAPTHVNAWELARKYRPGKDFRFPEEYPMPGPWHQAMGGRKARGVSTAEGGW